MNSTPPRRRRLPSRQVDALLAVLLTLAVGSGVLSWIAPDGSNGWLALAHGAAGLALVLLVPAKLRGSVRTGMRRGRVTRWLSVAFGISVLAALLLGILHSTGLWFGVGPWTALWTHTLLGGLGIPLLLWHVASRPRRLRAADLGRRALLQLGLLGGAGALLWVGQRVGARALGLAGGDRRSTGSHELASGDPAAMPTVIWLDDRTPEDTAADTWVLAIGGRRASVAALASQSRPVLGILDCTGGWFAEQRWDAVALTDLDLGTDGRSILVRSATGYTRRFPLTARDTLYLAVGYGGQPLRAGHGAPVRLVARGRRGPEWVKWVVEVRLDDRPAWLQPPLPLS